MHLIGKVQKSITVGETQQVRRVEDGATYKVHKLHLVKHSMQVSPFCSCLPE